MRDPLDAVVVGGTDHAECYARHLISRPDVRLTGMVESAGSPVPSRVGQIAADLGVAHLPDLAACPASTTIVVVATAPSLRSEAVSWALQTGRHLLVDKPVALVPSEARRFTQMAADAGSVATYVHRCLSPAILRARAAVDDGSVGLPRIAHAVFVSSHDAAETSMLSCEQYGGGEVSNFLGYVVDNLRFILGLNVESVYASGTSLTSPRHAAAGVESHGVISLLFERGVVVTAVVGRSAVSNVASAARFQLTIVGSQGAIRVDEARPDIDITVATDAERVSLSDRAGIDSFDGLLDDFFGAVREKRSPVRGLADGAASVDALDAARRSLASGQPEFVYSSQPE